MKLPNSSICVERDIKAVQAEIEKLEGELANVLQKMNGYFKELVL